MGKQSNGTDHDSPSAASRWHPDPPSFGAERTVFSRLLVLQVLSIPRQSYRRQACPLAVLEQPLLLERILE